MNQQSPDGADREPLTARGLHAREREQASHLAGSADKQLHGAAALTADVNLPFEDQDHPVGWLAFFEENVSGLRNDFFAMLRKPEAVFEGEPLERRDALKRGRDILSGRGTGRRG